MFVESIKTALAAGTMPAPVGAIGQTAVADPGRSAQRRNDHRVEIIITAQPRQQTVQDVAIATTVLGGDHLAGQKISSVEMFGTTVPNLVVQHSPFQSFVATRSPGPGAGGCAFEQSVASYVDGIYAGRASQFLNHFFNVGTTSEPSIKGTDYE
jgi:iron complex outermembrane receptor protein